MRLLTFIIDFMRAYAELLSVILWPAVVLFLFFVVWFSFKRSVKSLNPKRRAPLTWDGLHQLFSNMERQYLAYQPGGLEDQKRVNVVLEEIRQAKSAIENRDDRQVARTIAQLSTLAALSDGHLRDWQIEGNPAPVLIEQIEAILPDKEPAAPSSKSN